MGEKGRLRMTSEQFKDKFIPNYKLNTKDVVEYITTLEKQVNKCKEEKFEQETIIVDRHVQTAR